MGSMSSYGDGGSMSSCGDGDEFVRGWGGNSISG
jgi:hypothetical protein